MPSEVRGALGPGQRADGSTVVSNSTQWFSYSGRAHKWRGPQGSWGPKGPRGHFYIHILMRTEPRPLYLRTFSRTYSLFKANTPTPTLREVVWAHMKFHEQKHQNREISTSDESMLNHKWTGNLQTYNNISPKSDTEVVFHPASNR